MNVVAAGHTTFQLETERLVIAGPRQSLVPAIVRYLERNRAHLDPWEPARGDAYFSIEHWRAQIASERTEWDEDRGYRFLVQQRDVPDELVAMVRLSNVVRGPAQYANLGYSLDVEHQGKGLMHDVLSAILAWAFGPLALHRVAAAHLPRNDRSAKLLARLGFEREGLAKAYLRIGDVWEDHVLTAIVNDRWSSD